MRDICRMDQPERSPYTGEYMVPLPIMVMMDKANVGRNHQVSVFPVYIAFMIQNPSVRYKDGVCMIAHLPELPKKKMKKDRATHKQLSTRRLIHHCLSIMYDPLTHFGTEGVYLRDAHGKDVWVMPYVSYLNTDNEEQNDQCTLRRGAGKYMWPARVMLILHNCKCLRPPRHVLSYITNYMSTT